MVSGRRRGQRPSAAFGPDLPSRLHPADIEAIARRVAELIGEQPRAPEGGRLLTAGEVAQRFGVARGWAYANADRLGAVRLGDGPRARLRFDPARVAAAVAPRQASKRPQMPEPRRRRRSRPAPAGLTPAGYPLLPVPEPRTAFPARSER